MLLIESKEQLESWDEYKGFLKLQLKRITRSESFYVSKDKLVFDINGKPWRGHAVIAGPKADQCVRKLKKDGVIFRAGTCTRSGRDIQFGGEQIKDRYVKESEKTFQKLRLGYKLEQQVEEEPPEDQGARPNA